MSENYPYELYEVLPAGFNLLDATRDELDLYGIPKKPDPIAEPSLFDFWNKLVSPPFSARLPTFSGMDYLRTRRVVRRVPKPLGKRPPSLGSQRESMLNWSGALVSPPRPKRVVLATAGWIVPNVSLPSTPALFTHSNDPRSLVWVGLGGHNGVLPNISLPQIGSGHWPNSEPQHFAWWEWCCKSPPKEAIRKSSSPEAITIIDNLPIKAGDEILAGLAVLASNDVLYFIKNQSTGEFRSFLVRQPRGGIERLGSSVEWVVERPTGPKSGKLFPLPAYGSVDFRYCLARAANGPEAPGGLMTLADNALMIQMRETFADPYRIAYVSRATRRQDPDGSIGVTCTFHEPT